MLIMVLLAVVMAGVVLAGLKAIWKDPSIRTSSSAAGRLRTRRPPRLAHAQA